MAGGRGLKYYKVHAKRVQFLLVSEKKNRRDTRAPKLEKLACIILAADRILSPKVQEV